MIVADTNVIAYLSIEGEHTALAERVMRQDAEWIAPLLWRSEFRNLLLLHVRQEWFGLDHALKLLEQAEQFMFGREHIVSSAPVMNLAIRSGCSAYDCEFVVLAQEIGVPLVTSDQKILSAFSDVAVSMNRFVST
jgi:predicted nucleic acid-binding protein